MAYVRYSYNTMQVGLSNFESSFSRKGSFVIALSVGESGADPPDTEGLPAADSNSSLAEEQTQEEEIVSSSSSQNSWVASIKPIFLNQEFRSGNLSEECALHYLTRAVAKMIDNTGFSTCDETVLYFLTNLCQTYMQKLWVHARVAAEHGNRQIPTFEDADFVFYNLMFSIAEMHDYMKQVQNDPMEIQVPLYPVKKEVLSVSSSCTSLSDKDSMVHLESITPADHPDWCIDRFRVPAVVAFEPLAALRALTGQNSLKMKNTIIRVRMASNIAFPDFSGLTAKKLGFVRPQKLPQKKVTEEPSGILSSANIAALRKAVMSNLANNVAKIKNKKFLPQEHVVNSKNFGKQKLKSGNPNKFDKVNKPSVQRSNGMFGMPPSVLVHSEIVVNGKLKRKDKGREKDRMKEKVAKYRVKENDKDKKGEKSDLSSAEFVNIASVALEKVDTCSTPAENPVRGTKRAFRMVDFGEDQEGACSLSDRLSFSKDRSLEQDLSDLKNGLVKQLAGKEKNFSKISKGRFLGMLPYVGRNGIRFHVAKSAKLQHWKRKPIAQVCKSSGDSNGKEVAENTGEGVKEKNQNDDKDIKGMVNGIFSSKTEKCNGEVDGGTGKVAKRSASEASLAVIPRRADNAVKEADIENHSTSHDSLTKPLKVVLSRPSGKMEFTASAPKETDRTVKDTKQENGVKDVQHKPIASSTLELDKSFTKYSHSKKKKHKKERDREKHHGKNHKRKDKKDKEHKKVKTDSEEVTYEKRMVEKSDLKRHAEGFPSEIFAPKIPKLKIRLGVNSNGVEASPSGVAALNGTIASSEPTDYRDLLGVKLSEQRVPNGTVNLKEKSEVQNDNKLAPIKENSTDKHAPSYRRLPVTKAELKALPTLVPKTTTSGTKGESEPMNDLFAAQPTTKSPAISINGQVKQKNYVELSSGKRLRIEVEQNGDVSPPTNKRRRNTNDENSALESKKRSAQPLLTNDRSLPKEATKKVLVKENGNGIKESAYCNGQIVVEESKSGASKLGKEKDSEKHVSISCLTNGDVKSLYKDKFAGKTKERHEVKKEKHRSDTEKARGHERDKAYHSEKTVEKRNDHKRLEEKMLEKEGEEKRGQHKGKQKEKGGDGERKKGDERREEKLKEGKMKLKEDWEKYHERGKEKARSEGNKYHSVCFENGIKQEKFDERAHRKYMDKKEVYEKNMGKEMKKIREKETREKEYGRSKHLNVEEKVKDHDKEAKCKDKKQQLNGKENGVGGSNKEKGVVGSRGGETTLFDISDMKTKHNGKDSDALNGTYDPGKCVLENGQASFSSEHRTESTIDDVFGSGTSSTDSFLKSSDKKSSTLESEDSLDNMWICPECSVAYVEGATDMVGCDACDNWFHWSCVNLLVAPPDDAPWYCPACIKKQKKKGSSKGSNSKKGKK